MWRQRHQASAPLPRVHPMPIEVHLEVLKELLLHLLLTCQKRQLLRFGPHRAERGLRGIGMDFLPLEDGLQELVVRGMDNFVLVDLGPPTANGRKYEHQGHGTSSPLLLALQ